MSYTGFGALASEKGRHHILAVLKARSCSVLDENRKWRSNLMRRHRLAGVASEINMPPDDARSLSEVLRRMWFGHDEDLGAGALSIKS